MWRAASVSVNTSRRLPWNSNFQQAKKGPLNSKFTTVQSKMKTAKNSNFCSTSNRGAVLIELMKTKMLDASKDKTSILFEDRLDHFFKSFELLVSALTCPLYRMNRRCISL